MNKEERCEERTRCIEIDKVRFVKERRATRETRREIIEKIELLTLSEIRVCGKMGFEPIWEIGFRRKSE